MCYCDTMSARDRWCPDGRTAPEGKGLGVGARGPQQSTETVCEGLKALAVRMEVQVRVLGQWEEGE